MRNLLSFAVVCCVISLAYGEKKSPNDINIFCWVVAGEKDYYNAEAMANTWGEQCNVFKTILVKPKESTAAFAEFTTISDIHAYVMAFEPSFYDQVDIDEYDWILVVHVETFVPMDNLRQQLSNFNSSVPQVFSCPKKIDFHPWIYFECGLLVSRGAYKTVSSSLKNMDHNEGYHGRFAQSLNLNGLNSTSSENWTDFAIDVSPMISSIPLIEEQKLGCLQSQFFIHYVPVHAMRRLQWKVFEMRTNKWIDLRIDLVEAKIVEEIEKTSEENLEEGNSEG